MNPEDAAYQELQRKTLQEIQVETAYTWAYRARAAMRLANEIAKAGRQSEATRYWLDAEEYKHEAIEHGALAGDTVLASVRVITSP